MARGGRSERDLQQCVSPAGEEQRPQVATSLRAQLLQQIGLQPIGPLYLVAAPRVERGPHDSARQRREGIDHRLTGDVPQCRVGLVVSDDTERHHPRHAPWSDSGVEVSVLFQLQGQAERDRTQSNRVVLVDLVPDRRIERCLELRCQRPGDGAVASIRELRACRSSDTETCHCAGAHNQHAAGDLQPAILGRSCRTRLRPQPPGEPARPHARGNPQGNQRQHPADHVLVEDTEDPGRGEEPQHGRRGEHRVERQLDAFTALPCPASRYHDKRNEQHEAEIVGCAARVLLGVGDPWPEQVEAPDHRLHRGPRPDEGLAGVGELVVELAEVARTRVQLLDHRRKPRNDHGCAPDQQPSQRMPIDETIGAPPDQSEPDHGATQQTSDEHGVADVGLHAVTADGHGDGQQRQVLAHESPHEHEKQRKCEDGHPHVPRFEEEPWCEGHGDDCQAGGRQHRHRRSTDAPGHQNGAGDGREMEEIDGADQGKGGRTEHLVERVQQVGHARPGCGAEVLDAGRDADEGWVAGNGAHQELGMGEVAGEVPRRTGDGRQRDAEDDRCRHHRKDRVPTKCDRQRCAGRSDHGSSATIIRATRSLPSVVKLPSAARTAIMPSTHVSHHWHGSEVAVS